MNKVFNILFLLTFLCASAVFAQSNEQKHVYGVLLDNTGSMRTQIDDVKNFGKSIVKEIGNKGTISMLNFRTEGSGNSVTARINVGVNWGEDKEIFTSYIDKLEAVVGQTSLFDSILSTAEMIDSKAGSENEKVLILVTDGEDRASETKEKELIKFLKEKKIKVYAVGLIGELSQERGFTNFSSQTKAKNFFKKMVKETGGKVIFPKSKQKSDDAVKDLFAETIK